MTSFSRVLVGVGVAWLGTACTLGTPPQAKAAAVAQAECAGARASQEDVQLLRTTTVLKAEPIYTHVHTNTSEEERVNGARLLIRPPTGLSAERLSQILQCHSARVLLGQVDRSSFGDDPYFLPDAWVDIDVRPQAGNFAVTLTADTVAKNLQVLERASAFADTHASVPTE